MALDPSALKHAPRLSCLSEETLLEERPRTLPEPLIRDILTRPVIVAVANYGALSLLDIAFSALLPLFYASPVEAGGLGFSPSKIGLILGCFVSHSYISDRSHSHSHLFCVLRGCLTERYRECSQLVPSAA